MTRRPCKMKAFLRPVETHAAIPSHLQTFAAFYDPKDHAALQKAFEVLLIDDTPSNTEVWKTSEWRDEAYRGLAILKALARKHDVSVFLLELRLAEAQLDVAAQAFDRIGGRLWPICGSIAEVSPVQRARAYALLASIPGDAKSFDWRGHSPKSLNDAALACFDRSEDVTFYGELMLNKGLMLLDDGEDGYRDPLLREAAVAFEAAVAAYDEAEWPENRAEAQVYLAFTLMEMFGGEEDARIETMLSLLEAAMPWLSREIDVNLWATAWLTLGGAYAWRVAGRPRENLSNAKAAYKVVLGIYEDEGDPNAQAQALAGLCAVSAKQALFLRQDAFFEEAVDYGRRALRLCDREAPAGLRITIALELSDALSRLRKGRRRRNLKEALRLLERTSASPELARHPDAPQLLLGMAQITLNAAAERHRHLRLIRGIGSAPQAPPSSKTQKNPFARRAACAAWFF